ncbi:MAG: DUF3253 domain-containing protein [Verrucomicrobiota bacterium]
MSLEEAKAAIRETLAGRAPGKSICPSEAAKHLQRERWRERMEVVRTAARELAEEGVLEITQKGQVLSSSQPFRGPIRLRRSRFRTDSSGPD